MTEDIARRLADETGVNYTNGTEPQNDDLEVFLFVGHPLGKGATDMLVLAVREFDRIYNLPATTRLLQDVNNRLERIGAVIGKGLDPLV